MANLFEASSILYFLILPMIIGMGIDSRYGHRYAVAAAFGSIFYLFCGIWGTSGQTSILSEMEPIIILIVLGLSMLIIGIIFEWGSDGSILQRNALVFLTVSVAGIPLFMIKYIGEGKLAISYPASLLPLLQFTLALIALVVLANIFETRIYHRNEGRMADKQELTEDEELLMDYEAMDEGMIEALDASIKIPDSEGMDLDCQMDEF